MVTALSGGVTIIESESGNQDWVASSGDPDDIDLDNFTEGTDYIHIKTFNYDPGWKTKINKQSFPGHFQVATPLGEDDEIFPVVGFVDDLATRKKVYDFIVNHGEFSDNTAYIIVKHGSGEYEPFADSSRVLQDYAPGYVENYKRPFDAKERQFHVRFIFTIVQS
jgi:hypothetical protein